MDIDDIIELIYKNGDLNKIKKIVNDENVDVVFRYICTNGHLEFAKWLMSTYKNIDIHADYEYAFRRSCENGHLKVAKWVYNLGDVDIHTNDEWAFGSSCEEGHLTVAKWLYSLGDVDIHADDEYAFRYSCISGHLKVAKWLYSLGNVDIHSMGEWAFMRSTLEITKWLCKISDKYDYYIDGFGETVRTLNKYKFNKNPFVIRCSEFSDIKFK